MKPSVHAQQNDQQRLYAVHNQGEHRRVGIAHAVEHHHRDDSKMPGACSVGRRYDDSKRAAYEHHQSGLQAERAGEVEAKEGQVEMQEIAHPDGYGIKDEKPDMIHLAEGHDAFPHAAHHAFHLLIEGKHPQQIVEQHPHAYHRKQRHIEPRRSEQMEQGRNLRAGLAEEADKDRHLQQESAARDQQDAHTVQQAFGHHRTQRLGKGYSVVARQHAAARHLAYTRQHQVGGVGHKDGIHAIPCPGIGTQRRQRLLPAPSAEHMAHHSEKERQQHPSPRRAVQQDITHTGKVKIAVHPIEDEHAQSNGEHHAQYFFQQFVHSAK